MSRCTFSVLLSSVLLSACSAHLQKASDPWDQPKPSAQLIAKQWGPDDQPTDKQASAPPVKPQKPALGPGPRSGQGIVPGWQIQPPDLNPEAQAGSVIELARQYLGTPYRYGGESPGEGFDCSGLVHYVFGLKGIAMRRLANEQFLQGTPVAQAQMQPGDLVFFSTSGKIVDHVGIYAGNRQFIHAPRTGRTVSYDSLDAAWYSSRFQGARRIK